MTATDLPLRASAKSTTKPKAPSGTFSRLAKYTGVKVLVLFLTVVVAVYVTILIANMGEYVDDSTEERSHHTDFYRRERRVRRDSARFALIFSALSAVSAVSKDFFQASRR
jgi:ABC-type Fe3+ transport system permease subunit